MEGVYIRARQGSHQPSSCLECKVANEGIGYIGVIGWIGL